MGGESEAPQVTQTASVNMSPEQKKLHKLAMPFIEQYAAQPLGQFEGQTLAGFTLDELLAQAGGRTAATVGGTAADQALASNNYLMSPDLLNPSSNPYLKAQGDAITGTVTNNLLERILPSIRSNATLGSGMYSGGSTREGVAQGLAVGKTNEDISNALANLYGQAYQTGLSTIGSAVGRTPMLQAAQLFGPSVYGAIGAQNRALEQATLDEAQKKYYIEQALPLLRAQELYGFIGATPGGTSTSTATGAVPQKNQLAGGVGGALSGAVAGNMLFPGLGGIFGGLLGGAAGAFA